MKAQIGLLPASSTSMRRQISLRLPEGRWHLDNFHSSGQTSLVPHVRVQSCICTHKCILGLKKIKKVLLRFQLVPTKNTKMPLKEESLRVRGKYNAWLLIRLHACTVCRTACEMWRVGVIWFLCCERRFHVICRIP